MLQRKKMNMKKTMRQMKKHVRSEGATGAKFSNSQHFIMLEEKRKCPLCPKEKFGGACRECLYKGGSLPLGERNSIF